MLQENKEQALSAYKEAQALKTAGMTMSGQMLKMKIESLDDAQKDKLFPAAAAQ